MDTDLLQAAAAVMATAVAYTSAGNMHYRQPIPSLKRLAVILSYLSTGKTSCALKQVDNCERIIQFCSAAMTIKSTR